jgi:hypothetical protein
MWGFNAARNIDRLNDELDSWMPDDRDVSGMLIKHGRITGLDQIKYERTLEIVPSITIAETGSRKTTVPLSIARRNGSIRFSIRRACKTAADLLMIRLKPIEP